MANHLEIFYAIIKKFTVNGDLTKLGQNGHSKPEY